MPVVVSTVGVKTGVNTGTAEEIKAEPPNVKEIDRSGVNAWEDAEFRQAIEATGRKNIVMAGLWTEVCLTFPALDMQAEGYNVYPVADAVGGISQVAHDRAIERMQVAGATPVTAIQFGSEPMRNWARESSDKFRDVLKWCFPKRFGLMKEGKARLAVFPLPSRAKHHEAAGSIAPAASVFQLVERLQPGLDSGAARLQEGRQRKRLAHRLERFIDRKAGCIRGDLEQVAARLTEVERAKIVSFDLTRGRDAKAVHMLRPVADRGRVGHAEGDVMHRARALPGDGQAGLHGDVQLCRRTAAAHLEHMHLPLAIWAGIVADPAHVHHLRQHRLGRGKAGH